MWRLRPDVLVAALWAAISVTIVRRRLKSHGVRAVSPRAPKLPARAGLGAQAVLTRLAPTCIEKALVAQAWLKAQGEDRDVVVGVPTAGMSTRSAHAWVAGTELANADIFTEVLRLPPRPPRNANAGADPQ